MENIVEFRNVHIHYPLKNCTIKAVNDVCFALKKGKITALVGESGSGKTTIASSLLKCIGSPGVIAGGEVIFFDEQNGTVNEIHVEKASDRAIRSFRWEKVSMVFQSAQSALNPVMTVKAQFFETFREHGMRMTEREMEQKAVQLLEYVKLDAKRVLAAYPHELSGGMKQRVMIAFSLLLDPKLILLDEPTTALDVITQSYIFNLLRKINAEKDISMLLMTHDISVVASFADYMGVMYGGQLMEYGTVEQVFENPRHPYTKGLIAATPSIIDDDREMKPIEGEPIDLLKPPNGCVFSPRCPHCFETCRVRVPETVEFPDGSFCKCHLSGVPTDEAAHGAQEEGQEAHR